MNLFLALTLLTVLPTMPNTGPYGRYTPVLGRVQTLKGDPFRRVVDSIFLSLDRINDTRLQKAITRRLSEITRERDEIAHIRSLTYMARYADTIHPEYFARAYLLAEKHHLINEMDYVEDRWSRFYLSAGRYDSAVVHILKLQNLYRQGETEERHINILNLFGDLYYNIRLYDKAREVYLSLFEYYYHHGMKSYWRYYVVMDNLGQICMLTRNYPEALYWFNLSLKNAEKWLVPPERDNFTAYIRACLADVSLEMEYTELAAIHMKAAETVPAGNMDERVLQTLLFVKSKLLLRQGKPEDARRFSMILIPSDSNRFNQYAFIPGIYRLLADIWTVSGNPGLALTCQRKYSSINDSMESEGRNARTMIIMAGKENEINRIRLANARQSMFFLVSGMMILVLLLIAITVLYVKLYQSKLTIVRKYFESCDSTISAIKPVPSKEPGGTTEEGEMRRLILRMETLMKEEELYLGSHLNLQVLAQRLESNRTYLSRAINTILGTSFPNFINSLRIRKAIELIGQGYMVNHTQEAMAKACGFANRSVFINAFKKQTGVTPSFFITNYQELKEKIFEVKEATG